MDELLFLLGVLAALTLLGGSLSGRRVPPHVLLPGILLLMGTTLAAYIVMPLGIPLWVPYLASILLAFWLPASYAPVLVALGCSTLTLVGGLLSPPGVASQWSLLN